MLLTVRCCLLVIGRWLLNSWLLVDGCRLLVRLLSVVSVRVGDVVVFAE